MNVNKAAYEVVTILGSACKYNVILFCVINLFHYTCERLSRPIDLRDDFFGSKYEGEQLHLFELHTALDSFVRNIEETFAFQRERGNAFLVGMNAGHVSVAICEQEKMIMEYAKKIKIDKALSSHGMLYIKNDDNEVREKFFHRIDTDHEFEEYVPMKFMFLRCVLNSTKKLFITREELETYGISCHLNIDELDSFLDLFCKCCSLCVFKTKTCTYVVLQPANFVKGLEKLYKEENRVQLDYGMLTKKLARSFWNESDYKFYTSVLTSFGLMIEFDDTKFFMPSLRSKYDTRTPTRLSNSLIVLYKNVSLLPFHKQCEFVTYFQNVRHEKFNITLKQCSDYNVVKFTCRAAGSDGVVEVAVRFRCEYLELNIVESTFIDTTINIEIAGFFKEICINLLNRMEFRGFRSHLAIVCPDSKEPPHWLTFKNPKSTQLENHCSDPQCGFNGRGYVHDKHPAINWVKSEIQDKSSHPDGKSIAHYRIASGKISRGASEFV